MTSMVMRRFAFLVFLAACVIVTTASTAVNSEGGASASTPPRRRPNFVLFLVDDLGYGDLSCFGNETIRTPNIDEMAANGVKLTSLISAAPICTPSRAAILTGRYPVRSGMTSAHNNFRTYMSAAQPGGLPLKEITLAEKLKEANYSTALIGKWHLGVNSKTISRKSGEPTQNGRHLPTEHGFDYFFGMPLTNVQTCGNKPLLDVMSPRTYWRFPTGRRIIIAFGVGILTAMILYFTGTIGFLAMSCWVAFTWLVGFGLFYVIFRYTVLNPRSCTLMRNKEIVEQPIRLPGLTQRLTAEAQSYITQHKDEPFFLFFSDVKVHTALFTGSEFAGRSGKGDFVDNVEEMDWSVGELVRTLRENGLENDTVIFFTSDNGPFLEEGHEAGTAGYILDNLGRRANFKGGKGTNYEGGVRVAGIVQYKGHVRPQVSDQLVSTMDIMPTFLSLANVPLPSDRAIDGKDLSPLLFSDSALLPGGCTPPLGSDGGSTSAEDNFATVSAPPLTAAGSAAPNVSLIHNALFHWCGPSVTAIRHGHFKAHFQADKFDIEHQAPGGPHKCEECCPDRVICRCDGYKLDPPLLYNLFEDPGERRPINPSSELYQNELTIMRALIEAHEASLLSAPDTSHSQLEVLPRPWLEPCCNPPHCRCCHQCSPQEEREHQLKWASLLV